MVIKKKDEHKFKVDKYSFSEISSFDEVPFDNRFRNLLSKEKHKENVLDELSKDASEYCGKPFASDEKRIKLEDFTAEVKKIEHEIKRQREGHYDLGDEEEENEQILMEEESKEGGAEEGKTSQDEKDSSGKEDSARSMEDMKFNFDSTVEKVDVGSKLFHEAMKHSGLEEGDEGDGEKKGYEELTKDVGSDDTDIKSVDSKSKEEIDEKESPEKSSESHTEPTDSVLKKKASFKSIKEDFSVVKDEKPSKRSAEDSDIVDIEAAKREGFHQGWLSGEEKGYLSVQAKVNDLFSKVGELLQELEEVKRKVYSSLEQNFKLIIEKTAKRVIHKEISLDQDILKQIFYEVIEKTAKKDKIKVKINPDDYEYFQKLVPNLKEMFPNLELTELIKDPGVNKSNFIIETEMNVIDSSVDRQIEHMVDQLDLSLTDKKVS